MLLCKCNADLSYVSYDWYRSQVVQDPAPTLPQEKFSKEFNDFIPQCVNKNPNERASYTQLLDHEFLVTHAEVDDTTMGSFIKEILDLSPGASNQ